MTALADEGSGVTVPVRRPGLDEGRGGARTLWVAGGAALAFEVAAGDRLAVEDSEGRQRALIAAFGPDGRTDASLLIPGTDSALEPLEPGALQAALPGDFSCRLPLDLEAAAGFAGLGGESRAGDRLAFEARQAAVVVVAAPGVLSSVAALDAPTELKVTHQRAGNVPLEAAAPPPLADPLQDLLVARRSGEAYEVKAGDYIQVLDIAGRQCSDFIAFPRAALDRGLERFIDSTVTRTMVGAAYPAPGLLDKFYDQDNQALVQVVQDTCGRHDTFGLACTARVYERKGFFEHPNCSDNISSAMAPYGVAARAAWPAINFFFNTAVAAGNAILSDEGWSRPGDYVLMKALTDLVCVSTACPDDTSPINGWEPTDVQVRIYGEENLFRRAVAVRPIPEARAVMTRETGFHSRTSALTRDYRLAQDCWIPGSFTDLGPVAEYWACRDAATIQDLSQLRKIDVTGPDAETLLDRVLTRDLRRLAVGACVYAAACREHGGMFDDGILFRLGPDGFRWTCGAPTAAEWLQQAARDAGLDVWVRNATESLANLAVQGPKALDLLRDLVWAPEAQPQLAELKRFRFLVGRLHDFNGPGVLVSRTGFTGELGYEIFCAARDAEAVWDAIREAGRPQGLQPMGLDALDLLRIEAGLPVAGQEFSDEVDPFEAGVGFTVALKTKDRPFIGRDALSRNAAAPRRRLAGLMLAGAQVPRHGDPVFQGRAQVGVVTSACHSPRLGQAIALARLAVEHSETGTALEIGQLDGQQKRLAATVTDLPFQGPGTG